MLTCKYATMLNTLRRWSICVTTNIATCQVFLMIHSVFPQILFWNKNLWENNSNIFLTCQHDTYMLKYTPVDTLHPHYIRGPWSMSDRGLWRYENACKYFWGRKCTIISINTITLMKSLKSFKMLILKKKWWGKHKKCHFYRQKISGNNTDGI